MLRRVIFVSSSGRAVCILLFLVFLVLCGFHVAGTVHVGDSPGLGLINGLSAFIILVALMTMVIPLSSANRLARVPLLKVSSRPSATVQRRITFCPEVPLRR